MKGRLNKFISALLASLLVLILAGALVACNKNKEKEAAERDRQQRAESISVLKDEIMKAMDESWSGEMSDADIAVLSNAGDYLVASGWADMACDVLKNSALQTGKITSLKNYVRSEDGQKLLEDFAGNAELIIPLMRSANFTPTDISNMTYDLLCALVAESGNTVDRIIARIAEIRKISGLSADTVENLEVNSLNIELIKTTYVPNAQEKERMLGAFANAKAPLGEIVEFAYNMSIGSITDNIFNALFSSDGALSDITNGEISTVINTLLRNAEDLKTALDDASVANLNTAIDLIITKFDNIDGASTLYGQVVQYAKYVNMFVDVIPAMCDIVGSAGKVFDESMIENLRGAASPELNEMSRGVNFAIIAAKTVLQTCEDFSKDQLADIITRIGGKINGDYSKTLPLILLDVTLNISTLLKDLETSQIVGKHPDIIGESDIKIMVGTIELSMGLEKAKQTYRDYKEGKIASFVPVMNAVNSCGFSSNFGIENPFNPVLLAECEQWYNYYMITGVEEAGRKSLAVCEKAVRDIKQFIGDFYKQGSESRAQVEKIANWQFVSQNLDDAEYEPYQEDLMHSEIIGIIALFSMLISQ